MVPQIAALSVLGETLKNELCKLIKANANFIYSAKYCKFIRFKLLKSEQRWENIPTMTELVITSAYIKKLKLNFNKQKQGQDFSWEYKHTSGIYTRHIPTCTHFSHSHICILQNREFCFTHDEGIRFSKYASHGDWVIQTHHHSPLSFCRSYHSHNFIIILRCKKLSDRIMSPIRTHLTVIPSYLNADIIYLSSSLLWGICIFPLILE